MASKGRGHRTFSVGGFEVLVGKGDADNDALTFRVAEPQDFWLHVAGPPGSHVVVRNPERLAELPRDVLERCAALAAWHSKARGSRGKVEVHVCRVADVGKARGAPAGEVRLRRWESVRVYPSAGA
ncbi:MAG TPA: NFACT RNA binding domain-containing protein [Vicinamibacteria bacterium]|nr:NFACT RNA binding domain-containing protein [Vicinamibacteria bacterium]